MLTRIFFFCFITLSIHGKTTGRYE